MGHHLTFWPYSSEEQTSNSSWHKTVLKKNCQVLQSPFINIALSHQSPICNTCVQWRSQSPQFPSPNVQFLPCHLLRRLPLPDNSSPTTSFVTSHFKSTIDKKIRSTVIPGHQLHTVKKEGNKKFKTHFDFLKTRLLSDHYYAAYRMYIPLKTVMAKGPQQRITFPTWFHPVLVENATSRIKF